MSSKKNVLLIHAPFKDLAFGNKWEKTNSLAPPLGLMYLASPLMRAHYKITFIDLNVDCLTLGQFNELVKNNDFVGISCFSESLKNVIKMNKIIRKINPSVYLLNGGPHCNLTEDYINGADLVAVGEAEVYIVEILERLAHGKTLKGIPGLIYEEKGKLVRTKGIMQLENLDLSRHASFELSRDKDYGHFFDLKINNLIGTMTSRGCPFNCSFCTHRGIIKYRTRSVDNVINELKDLVNKGYKYFIFYDDNFLANKPRALAIMDRIIQEKINIKIMLQGRVDSADPLLFHKLREAGVAMIMFGMESANQDVLDFYNKQISVEKIKKAVELTNKSGILSFGWFIIGAPMETNKYFQTDLEFMDKLHLDFANISVLGYYQGSKLWDDALKKGLVKKLQTRVWANKKLSHFSYKELLKTKKTLLHNLYFNPARIARIFYKCLFLGELPLLFKFLTGLNKNFLKFVTNPLSITNKEGILIKNEAN